jgi:hypothetical protein
MYSISRGPFATARDEQIFANRLTWFDTDQPRDGSGSTIGGLIRGGHNSAIRAWERL